MTHRVLPSATDLAKLFALKYGDPATTGPNPRRRHAHNYFLPADVHEATVANAVFPSCAWLDVGGGANPFPDNPKFASELATRTNRFVGVDPSANVFDNPYTHEKYQAFIEDYTAAPFDLATLRMVAEHVTAPIAVINALARLVKPGGLAIVFTVDLWSPITVVSRVVPFDRHYPVKKLLWGGEEKDTFPTAYRMNTRRDLKRLFAQARVLRIRVRVGRRLLRALALPAPKHRGTGDTQHAAKNWAVLPRMQLAGRLSPEVKSTEQVFWAQPRGSSQQTAERLIRRLPTVAQLRTVLVWRTPNRLI